MHITRYLEEHVQQWLQDRMVFIGGPRQVGKTYFAKKFLNKDKGYYNWDFLDDRDFLRRHRLPADSSILIFDEIHKYPRWRSLLKGYYDKYDKKTKIIVTGSARLDLFRKGGDSLFGRYHYFRMHPLSLPEVSHLKTPHDVHALMQYGGFPEPFIKQDMKFAKIWRRERIARVIEQDLRDLTNLEDYQNLALLADLLPERVGSLLSFTSLAEDLEKSPHTIKRWIEILESVYMCFRLQPYGPPKVKALKKQNKLYLWDWSAVETPGYRFENLVASHLLKYCHFIEDTTGDHMDLRFLRDKFGREVDFVVLKNKKPLFAIEVKTGERNLSPHIEYFRRTTAIPKFYQVHNGQRDTGDDVARILPFHKFCEIENLV